MERDRQVSGRARALWVLAYAGATFLAFPHPLADRVVDLGIAAAWLAPACLLWALQGLPPRRAALVGLAAGVAAHGAVLHWIYVVTVTYGHAAPAVGVIAPLLLALYVALFTAAFGAAAGWLARVGLAGPFALAATWTALDHLRSFFLTGFPWATLGYAQHHNPALLGLASLTGVYGLSFVTVLGSASALVWLEARCTRPPRAAWAGLAVVVLLHVLGAARAVATDPEPAGPRMRIAVLQGNVDQGVKWSPAWAERTLRIYEELTREARAQGALLVVWPETAVPGSPDVDPELLERLARLAAETGAALVGGACRSSSTAPSSSSPPVGSSTATTRPTWCPSASTCRCGRCSAASSGPSRREAPAGMSARARGPAPCRSAWGARPRTPAP